jgi:uncharacterized protein (TIGR03437 family)
VVRIGGLACEVTFSGLMPGFVGAYQVNIRVPGGVPAGVQTLDVALGSTSVPVTVRMR